MRKIIATSFAALAILMLAGCNDEPKLSDAERQKIVQEELNSEQFKKEWNDAVDKAFEESE